MSTIVRVKKNTNYTVMCNYHLRDKNISLKAKGLMSFMLSLPETWDYSIEGLSKVNKEGVDSIRTAIQELVDAGYLSFGRTRNEKGHFGKAEYVLTEIPQSLNSNEVEPILENPILDKTRQISKDEINKDLLNKDNTPIVPQGDSYGKKKKQDSLKENIKINIAAVVEYLNSKTGRHFKPTAKDAVLHIGGRLKDGYTVGDCKRVVDYAFDCFWHKGGKWQDYVDTTTPFRASNFEKYLAKSEKPTVLANGKKDDFKNIGF